MKPTFPLTQDTVNRMIQESVKAAIRAERERIIMGNVLPNDPNVYAPAIVPAPIEGDAEEGEKDPKEDPEDDDDDMEMDDEVEVIDPYMDDGSNNPPPLNSKNEETPPTSLVIHDADGHLIPSIASFANRAEGPNVAPVPRECTFADFMKCSPITFRGNEGAVGLIRWIEKTEMVFTVATLGIEVVTRKTWAEIKVMMTEEFCPPEEIQRMEGELWNLRVKEMDISSYTTRFNELVILCPRMVPMERKKVEAYIRGLSEKIKGEVTSSEPATLNKAVRMAYTLMEQKVKAIAEREADNKKRKWENFQGGCSSGGGNNNSNRNNNNYNSN
nr:hypothetical protein [Tanacetum cinerariifolium]